MHNHQTRYTIGQFVYAFCSTYISSTNSSMHENKYKIDKPYEVVIKELIIKEPDEVSKSGRFYKVVEEELTPLGESVIPEEQLFCDSKEARENYRYVEKFRENMGCY